MTSKKKQKVSFEEGMQALQSVIAELSEGSMPLEDAMKAYEQGVALTQQLEEMLKANVRRIEKIDPETAEITDFEE